MKRDLEIIAAGEADALPVAHAEALRRLIAKTSDPAWKGELQRQLDRLTKP